jgi:hypothetical protein
VLVDWKGIEDEAGKAVPFSAKAAIEYFDVDDPAALFVFMTLLSKAADVTNFQPDDQEDLPEKN